MRLTVLGSSASYADAGRATAGYLVEADGTRILLDCGHGVLANLARVADPLTLDGVFISHGHPDHFADIYALQARLRYAPEGPAPAMRMWAPPGLLERMALLLSERGGQELLEAFTAKDLVAGAQVRVGGLMIEAHRVEHADDSFGLAISYDGRRLFYTGDAAHTPALAEAARGADVLLAEATLPEEFAGAAHHMTATQAAEIAAAAEVSTLVLTHLWPTVERGNIFEAVQPVFAGEVLVAQEMMEIEVE